MIAYYFMISVAAILNLVALYILSTRRPLNTMDTLLLHNFLNSCLYATLSFTQFTDIASHIAHHYIQTSIWFFGITQLFVLMLIAGQRFVAVYFPLQIKIWLTKRRVVIAIITTYFFVFVCVFGMSLLHGAQVINRTTSLMFYACLIVVNSPVMLIAYTAIFIKLHQIKKRSGRRKKLRPFIFSLMMTISNLISYVPIVLHIFRVIYPSQVLLLIWVDPICNAVLYIALKRSKKIGETFSKYTESLRREKQESRSKTFARFNVSLKTVKLWRNSRNTLEINIVENEKI